MPIAAALDPLFDAAGRQYDVDPNLIRAVSLQESGANPATADSSAGAQGLMQLMPATAQELGVENPYDPTQAIPGAARYLAQGLAAAQRLRAQGRDIDPAAYAVGYYQHAHDLADWGPITQAYVRGVAGRYGNLPPAAGVGATAAGAPPGGAAAMPQAAINPDTGLPPDLLRLAALGVSDVGPGPPAAPGRGFLSPDLATLAGVGAGPGAGMGSGSPALAAGAPSPAAMGNPAGAVSDASAAAGGAPGSSPGGVAPEIARLSDEDFLSGLQNGSILLRAPAPTMAGAASPRLVPVDHDPFTAPAAGAGAAAIPGSSPRTPPPGAVPAIPGGDPSGLLRAAEAAERSGLPDMANNYRDTYQTIVTSGMMPYTLPDGSHAMFPLPGYAGSQAAIAGARAGAEAGARAQSTMPFETVDAVVQGPNGPVRMPIPKDQYFAQLRAQMTPGGAAPAPAAGPGIPGAAPGGTGGTGGPVPAGAASLPGVTATTPQPGAAPPMGTLTGTPVAPLGYDKAVDRIDNLTTQANAAQNDLATITSLQDVMSRGLSTGWGADARLEAGRALAALGVSEDDVKNLTGISPSDAQEFNKQALRLSAQAVRGLGAREPGSVISLFGRAYPSIETQPQAIQFISNVLAQEAQRIRDQRAFMVGQFNAPGGNSYGAVAQSEADFAKQNPATAYLHAAEAMTPGYQAQAWGGAAPAEQQQILRLIPPGRTYFDPTGAQRHRGAATATP